MIAHSTDASRLIDGRYRVLERTGYQGAQVVVRATDLEQGGDVALRVLATSPIEDEAAVALILDELRLCGALGHPSLPRVLGVGRARSGRCYAVTPWVEGTALEVILESQPLRLEPRDVAALLAPVASALDELHANALIHRALDASCVVLRDDDDDGPSVLLTGFAGGAMAFASAARPQQLEHIAPEDDLDPNDDGRVDVYALATLAFRLLAGRAPYAGAATREAALSERRRGPPPTLQSVAREPYAPAVEEVIAKGLAVRREDRFRTAGAFVGDLWRAAHREPRFGLDGAPAEVPAERTSEAIRLALDDGWGSDASADKATRVALDRVALGMGDRLDSSPPPSNDDGDEDETNMYETQLRPDMRAVLELAEEAEHAEESVAATKPSSAEREPSISIALDPPEDDEPPVADPPPRPRARATARLLTFAIVLGASALLYHFYLS